MMKAIDTVTVEEVTIMAERLPPYAVDRERWAKLTIFEQMGNIGSEVGRAIRAKQQGKTEDCQQAVIRALDLFDATVTPLIAAHSVRAKEVLRAKEQFLEAIYGQSSPDAQAGIEQYFMEFAVAAIAYQQSPPQSCPNNAPPQPTFKVKRERCDGG